MLVWYVTPMVTPNGRGMLLDNIKSYETIDTEKPLIKQGVFGFYGMVKT